MLAVLAAAEPVAVVSIFIKAVAYAATLLAAGSALALAGLAGLSREARHALRRIAVVAALIAAIDTALRLPVRASFLTGGTWSGAMDPMMLQLVADSPLGHSVVVRLVGLSLILALAFRGRTALTVALMGAVLAAASFAFRGHALNEPRWLLGALVTVHILALGFWLGALAPLMRAARTEAGGRAGALAEEFGRKAIWIVGLLAAAGLALILLLTGATFDLRASAYQQLLALKLGLFAVVLGFAAVNKLRLTPDLTHGTAGAADRLRRSIVWEAFLIALILLVTATMTTVTAPEPDRSAARPGPGAHAPA